MPTVEDVMLVSTAQIVAQREGFCMEGFIVAWKTVMIIHNHEQICSAARRTKMVRRELGGAVIAVSAVADDRLTLDHDIDAPHLTFVLVNVHCVTLYSHLHRCRPL